MTHSIPLLGVPIHHVDFEQAMARIDELVDAGRADGRTRQVVTVNADFLVNATDDAEIHTILQQADLAVADGMPLVWAAKHLGSPLPERVAGSDLVPALGRRSGSTGRRIMFFGGAGTSAADAAALLRAEHPDADIVTATGMVAADGTTPDELLDEIRSAAPDVLCVGLGHPKQEHFIRRYADTLGVPVAMGTGATFEFISGAQARAPKWMQRSGLEWLHRMLKDPGRLVSRYSRDARTFFPAVRRQAKVAAARDDAAPLARIESVPGETAIDLSSVEELCRDDVVALSSFATEARALGEMAMVVGASREIRRQLADLRLDGLFIFDLPETPSEAAT